MNIYGWILLGWIVSGLLIFMPGFIGHRWAKTGHSPILVLILCILAGPFPIIVGFIQALKEVFLGKNG